MQSSAPPVIRPGNNNWWERNWKWFLPVTIVGAVGMFVGFIGLIVALVFGAIKSSDAYKGAIALAKADSRVLHALGSPLKEGFFVSGKINVSGGSGNASLAIPISGPKGKGKIYAVATKSAGVWNYSTLVLQLEGTAERIDLKEKNWKMEL